MSRRKSPVYVLVDCDNFFVSCERVFRPDLWNKPVAVLSNNDSCIVARSNEVKALGVPMGVPLFKVKDIFEKHNIVRFSGNFMLYGDFSQRVVRLLEEASPRVEVYSVDESFLEVSSLDIDDYEQWARDLRQKIFMWLGIPVSIGVAPTKTLAKAVAERVKKHPELKGAYSLVPDTKLTSEVAEQRRLELLKNMPLGEVWGIGWRTAPKLDNRGIRTAYDLTLVSDEWAKQQLTIRGMYTVKELRGEACYDVDDTPEPQQTLAVTRTFAHRVRAYHQVESAVATYAAKAAQKLRRFGQVAGSVMVFIAGDRHRDGDNYRRVSVVIPLLQPSNDTSVLIKAALQGLEQLYDGDFSYRRAGVVMVDLDSAEHHQLSWLTTETPAHLEQSAARMQALDSINAKYHTRLVRFAVEQLPESQQGPQRSPAYTTRWQALPKLH